jgi:hypothetical protein
MKKIGHMKVHVKEKREQEDSHVLIRLFIYVREKAMQ